MGLFPRNLLCTVAIDPNSLPRDAETLRKIVVDLAEQLDRSLTEQNKYQSLLRELRRRNATAKASSCRKSNWRCSKRPGRHGARMPHPVPAKTTMTSWAIPQPSQRRTKCPSENAAGGNHWRGI
jgi:hypothetical protein